MKLYRFHTQLNHGQRWSDYDILATNLKTAVALAEKIVNREEGLTGKPVKFQDHDGHFQTSGPKEVDLTDVEVLSYRVWQR
jgi:hypothetical protein